MKRRTIYIFVAIAVACLMLGILAGISMNSYTNNVLDSFVVSSDAVRHSNEQMEKIINAQIASVRSDSASVSPMTLRKVDSLRNLSDRMVTYVNNMRLELVSAVDGADAPSVQEAMKRPNHSVCAASIKCKDDVSSTMNYMYNKRNVSILTNELEEYRENILSLVECKNYADSMAVRDQIGLKMEHTNGRIWEDNLFYGVMLISASVAFEQIVGDVRNAEYEMLQLLMKQSDENQQK